LGFGKANNLGFKYATGRYIFLLNSDTLLLNNAIKEFRDAHDRMPNRVACLGCVLKAADGVTENNSYSSFPSLSVTWHGILKLYLRRLKRTKSFDDGKSPDFRVDYIIGADLFIRREVIEEVGLFDPDFFMYYEESEMQLRYARRGYESRIIRTPSIIHLEGASIGSSDKKPSARKKLIYFKSMFLYMRKRYGIVKYLLFRGIVLLYLPTFRKVIRTNFKEVVNLFFGGIA
jgi:GT2 family glycosyltransferase